MKVVLDSNILVSGIFFGGIPGRILDLWAEDRLDVYVTPAILEEYLRVIEAMEPGKKPGFLQRYWRALLPKICHFVPDTEPAGRISRDPSDDKFFLCARTAKARYLVTGDKDLKDLVTQENFEIISPRQLIERLI